MSDDELFDSYGDIPWETLGRINEEGYVEDPSIADDPKIFDDQFEQRSREIERRPAGLQPVSITPLRNGPWSSNNQLGIQQLFAPDINNQQTIIKLDEWGFPEFWTVCLGIDYDRDNYDADGTMFALTALINFGVGGATQEVEVDWLNGSVITLPMNALNVIARFNRSQNELGVAPLPQDLMLRVTLCKGAVQNPRPTRSYYFDTAGEDDIIEVPIPPFAKAVHIFPSLSPTPFEFFSNTTDFVRFDSSFINPRTITAVQRSQFVSYVNDAESIVGAHIPVPIPEGAHFIRIIAASGGGGFGGMSVQFLLGV